MSLLDCTAVELAAKIKAGEVTAVEAMQAVVAQIEKSEDKLNCYVTFDKERALQAAAKADDDIKAGKLTGPLAGVPFAIKDNMCTEGMLTTCSSKILGNFVPTFSSEAVIKLQEAGAVIIGKTNMDEFAMGSTTETSAFGATKNPRNTEHVPGGSSGGSAAAVAANECFAALGSDTGGSIRQPASYCGVVGMKPTYGTVSRYGLIAYGSSLDQIGPLCKDVTDCATIMEVIAAKDDKDSTSVKREDTAFTKALVDDVKGLKIGIPRDYFGDGLDPEVKEAVMSAAKVLEEKGAIVEEFDLSLVEYAIPTYYTIAAAEASSNLERFDGVKYGYRTSEYEGLHNMYKKTRSEGFGPEVKRRIMLGSFVLSSGYYDAYYLKALRVKALIKKAFDEAFAKYDVILGPVAPTTAPKIGSSLADPIKMYLGDIYTISVNLAGLPGISVPCGKDSKGLPIGVQLIGDCFKENNIIRAAYSYEQARGRFELGGGQAMKDYEVVIGLEVHVELATKTKIFCGCSTAFGGAPNTHTCPVCTGMPGSLPVLNKKVVEYAMAVGLATNCSITRDCKFDRKNYFYPDNPQNYQISQLYLPICRDGHVDVKLEDGTEKSIRIHEIHMEEDAGKLIHDEWEDVSYVDYNRSGVPLIEIVSEPDMRNAEEVIAYLTKLRNTIQYLGASDCKLQEGSMRADVNLSVREKGSTEFGTRTETKNLNSFSAIQRAIEAETARQIDIIEAGGQVVQETRRWNDDKEYSYAMRSKEDAQDYRYFPDPDLVPIHISEEWLDTIKEAQPEFKDEKMLRYKEEFGIPDYDINMITDSKKLADIFEETTALCNKPKKVSNWLITETMRILKEKNMDPEDIAFSPKSLARIIELADEGSINSNVAKEIFEKIFDEDIDPDKYIEEHGLKQVNDEGALKATVEKVIADNPQSVADYRAGKEKAIGFLVGQTMKAMQGKANPGMVNKLLKELL